MKRLFYFLLAIALLSGCEKAEDVGLPNQDNTIVSGDVTSTTLPEVLYAFIDEKEAQGGDSKTRTYVTDTNKIVWHAGDAISYFTGTTHNAKYVSEVADGSVQATFALDESAQGSEGEDVNKTYAVYPYNANTSVEDGVIKVNFPATQSSSSNPKSEKSFGRGSNIMVATGEIGSDELFFRNACGYLIIKLDSPQENIEPIIKSIKLTARGGEKIAGNANITINNDGIPSVAIIDDESDSSTITIDCTDGGVSLTGSDKAEFWFALPPVTLSQGIRIEVNAVDAEHNQLKFFKETNKAITIKRNTPQPMASLKFKDSYALRYKTESGNMQTFANGAFKSGGNNAAIASHYYSNDLGCYVINFEAPLTTIGEQAFKNKDITSITIPGSVTTIGNDAFIKCEKLAELTLEPSPSSPDSPDYVLNVGQDTEGGNTEGLFAFCPLETINFNRQVEYNYNISEQIDDTKVGKDGIFSFWYEELRPAKTTITIGEQVTTIPEAAFAYVNIESITIPATVTEIADFAFHKCTKLKEVTLAPSTTNTPLTVGKDTYKDDGVVKVAGLFSYCPLEKINFNRQVEYSHTFTNSLGGIFSLWVANFKLELGNTTSTINIGQQVTTIPAATFAYVNINAITIPATVTQIGKNAFYYCKQLATVTLGHNDPNNIPKLADITVFDQSWMALKNDGEIMVQSNEFATALKEANIWSTYASKIKVIGQ